MSVIEVFKNTFRSLEDQGNIFNRPRTKDSTKESFYVADTTNDEMENIISPHLIDASAQEVEVDYKPEEENILTQKISTSNTDECNNFKDGTVNDITTPITTTEVPANSFNLETEPSTVVTIT